MTMPKRSVRVFAWRYVSGAPLNGVRKTNATAFRFGNAQLHVAEQKPAKWSYWPRYIKGSIRLLAVTYALFLGWAALTGNYWILWITGGLILTYAITDASLYVVDKRAENASTRIPRKVVFKEIEQYIRRINCEDTPFIGFAMGKKPIMLDLDNDAPHGALSMGTGAGKSATLGGIVAQLLYGGVEHVLIVDVKVVSLLQFEDHPRVTYANTYEAMWEGILYEEQIMNERYAELRENPKKVFPRRVIIIEEGNSFASEIAMYYRNEMNGKGRVPIIDALGRILFKGRQARLNVIGAWQRLTVQAVADPAVRDQFGFKIMARFSVTAWKSLIGTFPIPRSSRHRGRAVIVVGDEQESFQMCFWTPAETREFAFANDEPIDATEALETYTRDQGEFNDAETKETVPDVSRPDFSQVNGSDSHKRSNEGAAVDDTVDYQVTLHEAIKMGLVGDLSYDALRAARQRDKTFPPNCGKRGRELIYSAKMMKEWNVRKRAA